MKLFTWNMQGPGAGGSKWVSEVSRLFFQEDADVVCLQACGSVPADAVAAQNTSINPPYPCAAFNWNLGSSKNQFPVFILWLKTELGGSLAIMAKPSWTRKSLVVVEAGQSGLGGLRALGIIFQNSQNAVLNIYTANEFFDASGNPTLLTEIDRNANGAAWFTVGDFNREPSDWVWNAQLLPEDAVLCSHAPITAYPGAGTNYDYAFLSAGASKQATAITGDVYQDFVISDHFPICYDLPF